MKCSAAVYAASLFCLFAFAHAQSSTSTPADFTGSRQSTASSSPSTASHNSSTPTTGSTTDVGTLLVGTYVPNSNGTSTSSAAQPSNTLPCNGYVEFCNRKYSNITFVGAHNSPFSQANNAFANQDYGVIAQLNDGIRMLQGQVHSKNGVLHLCHTSCDYLDAGPLEGYLANITQWLAANENRLEVVTILLGNGDYLEVGNFTAPIQNAGLGEYAFVPENVPMKLEDWPTLGNIILDGGKRALIFMDYKANQTQVPYIMDEFSQMWETPYDPTNNAFPCSVQRPPGLSDSQAKEMLLLENHNLNNEFNGISIPTIASLNQTNAASGPGSLGLAANNCKAEWGHSPNFMLVDYYNRGPTPGSVFQAAAELNGVQYTGSCCGLNQVVDSAAALLLPSAWSLIAVVLSVMLIA